MLKRYSLFKKCHGKWRRISDYAYPGKERALAAFGEEIRYMRLIGESVEIRQVEKVPSVRLLVEAY